MAGKMIIHIDPYELPPVKYRGKTRNQWQQWAENKLTEAKTQLSRAITNEISETYTGPPIELHLSVDIRTMKVIIDYRHIRNTSIIELLELYQTFGDKIFNIIWGIRKKKVLFR